jgi:tellurite resistance protein TerC
LSQRAAGLIGFHVVILIMLAIDLGVFHKKAHEVRVREAIAWSVVWIGLAFAFCGYVGYNMGRALAIEYTAAYLVEKSLSVDNIFVFVVIMKTFDVPPAARHRLLFWGVIGAIALRAPMIYFGVELLKHFHTLIYVFGGFLVYTGVRFLFEREGKVEDVMGRRSVRLVRWLIPTTDGYRDARFFVREGPLRATPLFTTLIIIELSDVLFALDSIPAVLALTDDFFIAYTSNIFAILGLRSLFFVVAAGVEKFHYLKPALSFILVFVGVKMVLGALPPFDPPKVLSLPLLGDVTIESLKIKPGISLGIIVLALLVAALLSIRAKRHANLEP